MRREILIIAALCVSAIPMVGFAQQDPHGTEGMQTGTRFLREPETAPAAEARWMQKRVANCVFNRNRDEVREVLANSNFYAIDFDAVEYEPETIFDELEVGFCMGRLMRGVTNETYQMYMQIPFATLRNLLAEEAYLRDFDDPPELEAGAVQDVAGRFAGQRVHPQISTMATLTDCMTFGALPAAHDLLNARPGTDDEDAAIDILGPVVAACANSGEAELTISPSLIRQMAADGMWSRGHYGSAPVEVESAK